MFLVPSWATECTISTMPSLTVQYMSDSGTVELSRDCGEEGTRHIPCRGQRGAERETILNELRCIDEATENITITTVPSVPFTKSTAIDVAQTSTRQPELQSISTNTDGQIENMEDNTIPNLIFSTHGQEESLMQADDPSPIKMAKSDNKRTKKVQINDWSAKKVYNLKKVVKKLDNSEEIMMGDQPVPDELLPLPHIKKSVTVDLDEVNKKSMEVTTVEPTATTPHVRSTTSDSRSRRQTESHDLQEMELTTSSLELTTVNEITGSLGLTEHPHNKVNENLDHFVPPMLLVRTKFNSMTSNPLADHHSEDITVGSVPSNETVTVTSVEISTVTEKLPEITTTTESSSLTESTQSPPVSNHDSTTTPAAFTTQSPTVLPDTTTPTVAIHTATTTGLPRFRSPHAPQRQPDVAHTHAAEPVFTTDPHGMAAHLPHHIGQITLPAGEEYLSTVLFVTTTEASPRMTTVDEATTQQITTTQNGSDGEETPSSAENTKQFGETSSENSSSSGEQQLRTDDPVQTSTLTTTLPKRVLNDLTNKDNYQPYKPNRHRSLTRPETQTYIKKMLG